MTYIKLVDYSTSATPGFGGYSSGNSSLKRIRGIGFQVFSNVANSTVPFTFTEFNNREVYNMVDYCGTTLTTTTQCDSPFMGFPNQTKQMRWCLYILNPYNNSQKAYVSFSPDETSTTSTKNDMSISGSGITKNINNEYFLLVLLILFQMLWGNFC
ncbi:13762_t:CDS:2 [Racocetra fulgida]|uniref:13762_t:CDS:1 n=1 Tax=Racocetra fulgida TaxID=60492 RepID=A0A9N8VRX1_9GLOM|nr:13762_t:CDS:2 [Racocetra fulgida]